MVSPRLRRLTVLFAVCALLACHLAAADPPSWEDLQAFYDYDAALPLEALTLETMDRGMIVVESVEFQSVNDEMVPALVCVPKGIERPPVILMLHGLGGSKDHAAMLLAPLVGPLGIAVVSIDAQYHGDREVAGREIFTGDMEEMVASFGQSIIDNRRALDYIESRGDLDAERIVLVGVSMGSIMGSIVTAVDQRIDGCFLIVGGGDLVTLFSTSEIGEAADLRGEFGDIEQYRSTLAFVEPTNFAAHIAPRPMQMLNGRNDRVIPAECAQALFEAGGDPKSINWYEGDGGHGHMPPLQQIIMDLRGFLEAQGFLPGVR